MCRGRKRKSPHAVGAEFLCYDVDGTVGIDRQASGLVRSAVALLVHRFVRNRYVAVEGRELIPSGFPSLLRVRTLLARAQLARLPPYRAQEEWCLKRRFP